MKNIKRVCAYLLIFVMSLGIVGCQAKNTPATKPADTGKKILKYSIIADPPSLDQNMASNGTSISVDNMMFEGLIRDHGGKVIPGIAATWEISTDALTYTFHLRDSKWSDGKALTAQDFEYGIKRLMDPKTASPSAFIGSMLKNGEKVSNGQVPVSELGVKAVDEKTLVITLESPTAYFLGLLNMPAFYASRKDIVESKGKEFATAADKNVYNGPFVLKKWDHEHQITLEKNSNYWNANAVKLDGAEIQVVPEQMTAVAMFDQGALDFVSVPTELIKKYKDKVSYYTSGNVDYLQLNMDKKSPLNNKNLRLAINNAISRSNYIDITTQGQFTAATRIVLPEVGGVNGKYGDEYPLEAFPVNGDLSKAKEYLQNAMKELNITEPSKIVLELLAADDPVSRNNAVVLQDQLQTNLGIKVTIKQVPYKQRKDMEAKRNFQMVLCSWGPDYSDPMTYMELWTTDTSYNHGSYSNSEYDKLISFAKTTTDKAKRMEALFKAEKILLEDGAVVPLDSRREAMLKNPKLTGLVTWFLGASYDYVYADFTK